MPTEFVAYALKEYCVLGLRDEALTVNEPVVPEAVAFVTPVPPMTGLPFVDVTE